MNPFKRYETDPKKEASGVRIEVDDMVFICRRAGGGNRAYRAAASMAILEPGMREKLEDDDNEVQLNAENHIAMVAFVETVVIGWENVLGRDDQPLPFTKENVRDLFVSCPEVWDMVRVQAQSRDSFRLDQVKEIGVALGNTSDGSESTEKI